MDVIASSDARVRGSCLELSDRGIAGAALSTTGRRVCHPPAQGRKQMQGGLGFLLRQLLAVQATGFLFALFPLLRDKRLHDPVNPKGVC